MILNSNKGAGVRSSIPQRLRLYFLNLGHLARLADSGHWGLESSVAEAVGSTLPIEVRQRRVGGQKRTCKVSPYQSRKQPGGPRVFSLPPWPNYRSYIGCVTTRVTFPVESVLQKVISDKVARPKVWQPDISVTSRSWAFWSSSQHGIPMATCSLDNWSASACCSLEASVTAS